MQKLVTVEHPPFLSAVRRNIPGILWIVRDLCSVGWCFTWPYHLNVWRTLLQRGCAWRNCTVNSSEGFFRVQFKHEVKDSLNGVNLNTEIINMRPFKLNINESHGWFSFMLTFPFCKRLGSWELSNVIFGVGLPTDRNVHVIIGHVYIKFHLYY